MKLEIISFGGTILQTEKNGAMIITPVEALLEMSGMSSADRNDVVITNLSTQLGAQTTLREVVLASERINSNDLAADAFIVLSGTDSIEEIAYSMSLLARTDRPVIITGAMRPQSAIGYDGLRNFCDSLRAVANKNISRYGVVVLMNEKLFLAKNVRKIDSQASLAIDGYPGPFADIRNGDLRFYFDRIPEQHHYFNINHDTVNEIDVQIVQMAIGMSIRASAFSDASGLVIAGMGTGSINNESLNNIVDNLVVKMPVILSTRCPYGDNFDDFYYKGSLSKYEDRGILVSAYRGLSAVQCRIKLIFSLAEKAASDCF